MADPEITRRDALRLIAAVGAGAAGCSSAESRPAPVPTAAPKPAPEAAMSIDPILGVAPLGFQWQTRDPFLFCVHHDDRYPEGNSQLGPDPALLAGRKMGSDFEIKDGFRMYHGQVVPGFPRHPHRGFETVTIVRKGLLDHSDSLGAGARYGGGDVQWLTAGAGIQHAEMFPLLKHDAENPLELFQIWLNLPARSKMVKPHFSMLWRETIPTLDRPDAAGRMTKLTVIAGRFEDTEAPSPPPNSYASAPESDLAIWTLKMQPGARITLPGARAGSNRSLYVFSGAGIAAAGRELAADRHYDVHPEQPFAIENGDAESEILMLQGRPIGEPVARHGPFVMNTRAEIQQAYGDFRRTQFGGWPWGVSDPVHGREQLRFARHADGRTERPA